MLFERYPVVYIMANKRNRTLYTGVTSNLTQRIYQHKQAILPGFTSQYGCKRLVYHGQCFKNWITSSLRSSQ